MFETVWPRVRTLARLFGFLGGLAVIGVAGLSILQSPTTGLGGEATTAAVAPELLAIVAACLWMLLMTKI